MDLLKNIITVSPLEGYRTYIVGYALMVFAVAGFVSGKLTTDQAVTNFGLGAGMVGLRLAK